VRQLTDANAEVVLVKEYAPYGSLLSSDGTRETSFGYTSEQTSQGLVYLRARYYAPWDGRFISRDTWVGDYTRPLSLNKWIYAEGNPIRFVDPTGHYICERSDCYGGKGYGEWYSELERQDILFSKVFKGSGINGTWTHDDWKYYCKHRNSLYLEPETWRNPDIEKGWKLFALHAGRLASHYSLPEKTKFVRDFALLFSGVPSESHWISAAYAARSGPAIKLPDEAKTRSYLSYKNTGLSTKYLEINKHEDQSQKSCFDNK
jgi:RHS repeat-associated protein